MRAFFIIGLASVSMMTATLLRGADSPDEGNIISELRSRAAEEDPESGALLKVHPRGDAPEGTPDLQFSLKKGTKSTEMIVTLSTRVRAKVIVYEQYLVRNSDLVQREVEKFARYAQLQEEQERLRQGLVLSDIQYYKQSTGSNLCVPTCAAMVLRWYGDLKTPVELKELSTPPDSDFAGTYFHDMVKGVAKLGYDWSLKSYPTTDRGFEDGFRDIQQCIVNRCPVLVDLHIPPIGHTVLIVGFNPKTKEVIFLDPLLDHPGVKISSYDTFKEEWRSVISDNRGAIYTKPQEAPPTKPTPTRTRGKRRPSVAE